MSVKPFDYPVISQADPIVLHVHKVSAGFPSPAGDDLEDEVDPIAWIVRHPSSTFWWRVEGDCLWDVGIRDGDLIAVDRAGKKRLAVLCLLWSRVQ